LENGSGLLVAHSARVFVEKCQKMPFRLSVEYPTRNIPRENKRAIGNNSRQYSDNFISMTHRVAYLSHVVRIFFPLLKATF
jgi:hypothetical protein